MNSCPTQQELLALLSEELDQKQTDELSAHVESCEVCNQRLSALTDASHFGLVKSPSNFGFTQTRAGERILQEFTSSLVISRSGNLDLSLEKVRKSHFAEIESGTQIGGYEILEQIGRGGMGTVYRARHLRLDRIVAIKILDAEQFKDSERVSRFHRETRAIGRLRHPNIVAAHDAGEFENLHYLVMEHVEGANLRQLMQRHGRLKVGDACEIIRQAATGLQHSHEAGLVHRDIKPSNLMLTIDNEHPTLKVLDLGLARIAGSNTLDETELTRTGRIVGTVDYMAPEQFGSGEIDIRADIYALGVTLFNLLTGQSPFTSSSDNLLERLSSRATQPHRSLCDSTSNMPAKLSELVDSMLAQDKSQRPATPRAVAEALEPLADDRNLEQLLQAPETTAMNSANTETVDFAAGGTKPTVTPQRAPATKATHDRRARMWQWGLAAALVATLALLAIKLMAPSRGTVTLSCNQNIEMEFVRDNSVATRVVATPQPQRISLPTGEYEVWMPEQPHERILVTNNRFSLNEGENRDVAITIEESPPLKDDPTENPTEDPGKSFDHTRTGNVVLFRNDSLVQVVVVWVGFDGTPHEARIVEPGQTSSAGAAHGHLFRFKANDEEFGYYPSRRFLDQLVVFSGKPGEMKFVAGQNPPMQMSPDDYFHIRSRADHDKALSVLGGANTNVGMDHAWNTNNQLFRFVPAFDEWYFIESKLKNDMVLTIVNTGQATESNICLIPRQGNGTSAQRFKVIEAEEGHVRIVSALGKLFHITVDPDVRNVVPGIYLGDVTTFQLEKHGK